MIGHRPTYYYYHVTILRQLKSIPKRMKLLQLSQIKKYLIADNTLPVTKMH